MVGTMPAQCTHTVFGYRACPMIVNRIISNYVNGVGKLLGLDASVTLFGTTTLNSIVGLSITIIAQNLCISISKKNC